MTKSISVTSTNNNNNTNNNNTTPTTTETIPKTKPETVSGTASGSVTGTASGSVAEKKDEKCLKDAVGVGLPDTRLPPGAQVAQLESVGVSSRLSLDTVGYSSKTTPATVQKTTSYRDYSKKLLQARVGLSNTAKYKLQDSIKFYYDITQDEVATIRDKMLARQNIDKLLGYQSPVQHEDISSHNSNRLNVMQVFNKYSINPRELKSLLKNDGGIYNVIGEQVD